MARPLHDLTKKNTTWKWESSEDAAFQALKKELTQAPILVLPKPELPYVVITDASAYALGAVLMQDHGRGNQPIAFASRRLTTTEAKEGAYNRELAAMAWGLAQWRHYLEGALGGVTVFTDHETATHFMR